MGGKAIHGRVEQLLDLVDRRAKLSDRYLIRAVTAEELLAEARDLLVHAGRHTKRADEAEFPPCPGCDLEARIDAVVPRCPSCGHGPSAHRGGYCLSPPSAARPGADTTEGDGS